MTADAVTAAPAEAAAPRIRGGWIWIAAILLVFGTVGAAIAGSGEWAEKGMLDPDSPGPNGALALAQILRENGVAVEVVRDRDAARAALGSDATLVLSDETFLSDEFFVDLIEEAAASVVLDPTTRLARVLFESEAAGFGSSDPVAPECDDADAERAGAITVGALYSAGTATSACYPSADGFGMLVKDGPGGQKRTLVDGRELFTNEHLADGGNASLAIGLLGARDRVVWYLPGIDDRDLERTPSLADVTPPWVTPVLVLLALTAAVAAVWRGRRFGPLVAENLPVTVRASETMEGRARLSAASADRVGALAALRSATTARLARVLGLGRATPDEVADAAASRLGVDRHVVRGILQDDYPATDGDLVTLADRLLDLEDAVRRTLGGDPTERTRP